MGMNFTGERKIKTGKNHRHDDGRQYNMGDKNKKIDRPNEPFTRKWSTAMVTVVNNVAD